MRQSSLALTSNACAVLGLELRLVLLVLVSVPRCLPRPGGAFSLSFSLVLSARLAPFHRLPFTTVHRESLLWRCFALVVTLVDRRLVFLHFVWCTLFEL